jgi:hypothetical protein
MWTKGVAKQTWLILGIAVTILAASAIVLLSSMFIGIQTSQSATSQSQSQSLTQTLQPTTSTTNNGGLIQLEDQQTGFGHTVGGLSCSMNLDSENSSWSKYLGYIPSGYCIAPRYPNSPIFPCPSGMDNQQCQLFQQTCGDGVCNPNETCQTCPIDCPVNGVMVCDPYTGRAGAPASVCQLAAQAPPPSP